MAAQRESPRDMLSRVEQMTHDDGTWDLSDNDIAALRFVLDRCENILVSAEQVVANNFRSQAANGVLVACVEAERKIEGRSYQDCGRREAQVELGQRAARRMRPGVTLNDDRKPFGEGERPFGSVSIGADMAASMGMDTRPYLPDFSHLEF